MSSLSTVPTPPLSGPVPGTVRVGPRRGWQAVNLADVWRYRELLGFLALRDIQVRYKQTVLGAAWAVIQPLLSMVVISFVLRRCLGAGAASADPVFLYAALLPWTFFASAVNASSNSLVSNANMLRKVYFPRLLVPLASVGAPLVDYAVASVVLVFMMLWFGVAFTSQLLLVPLLALSTIIAALGVGVVVSGLTVTYRDFRYVVPFAVQVGFFVTPVMYAAPTTHWLYNLNPMAGTITAFRAAILNQPIDLTAWGLSAASGLACLLVGLVVFARIERRFADVV